MLPDEDKTEREKKKFKEYPIGFMHVDITKVGTAQGKCYLFVVIDRAMKYVYTELHVSMTMVVSESFLNNLISDCPFKIHTILTDNGAQFTYAP